MSASFLEAIKNRRSVYALGKDKTVSNERVRELVEYAVTHVPSAFNSQNARVVVLFGAESERFWALTVEALRPVVPAEAFGKTAEKLASFAAGLGTILFFEDLPTVESLQAKFPLYRDNFPVWSLEANGMLQFAVWTALEDEGLGASLQHYNPLVDAAVRAEWKVPEGWRLRAQMPFGSVREPAGEKEFLPIESRVKAYG
jgi:predicted oxidoreductase (fatty acid repression mutant protein)